ncbi:substrate-binding domain-containing protein [Trinickia caryophylli]|uniref:Phosphate ABC transporter substrate-binding protein, PhoT family n=1 Tax=Trinickia caryophylli TaxID=28094 RepID=A0A1X7DPK3_TRICW|nr:substrate-binding domain-containing protein [Trinickia caryophylli]PMS10594.1 phosphate ABC transporter substrate-binding protein [Trinickia caryophylli]TRX17232.1 extracellular solute-binding protein [Trinickia caryophylli]WQE12034.1 substrate-binding domain-containing protein [Trinickia caryophylli]SMF19090.1 phosphate ABC transporter substrate-binding protein, PhoT family [Trinickia caryophylli]GLU31845.1 alkaline phosphatase L [Trinickia caryophylli]
MKSRKHKICQAIALVISALGASAAMAQTAPALLGGGSSLVAPSIGSEISLFPAADGTIRYFSVGSGAGQTAFLQNRASSLGSTVTGTVDFANSDAALSTAQVSAYTTSGRGLTDGPMIQIPFIVTPITIPVVNGPTGTGPSLPGDTAKTVALNDDDLCGIFSGKLTNWNQVKNPDTNAAYSLNAPITVVYRSDNSGTTDLLTRHLAAVCTTGTSGNSNIAFTETQNFASLFTTLPTRFVAASGSGGVASQLVSLRSAGTAGVGYLSPDYTNTFLAPKSAPAQTNNLSVASLRNRFTNADVTPTADNAATALAAFAPPTFDNGGDPTDPTQWVPNAGNPTVGYPVSGTSQIILSQCYANPSNNNPSPGQGMLAFLNDHYTNASFTSIVTGNGFKTVPANYLTEIQNDFLSNGSGLNLDLNNAGTCSAYAGR